MTARPPRAERRRLFGLGVALVVAVAGGQRVRAAEPPPASTPASTSAKTASSRAEPVPPPEAKPGSDAQKRARRLFQDAEAHFHSGLFAEALGEYQAGYDAAALPGFLINIAQCQRRLGNLTGALTTYRKFIMVAPDSPYVPQVQSLVTDLEKLARDTERERERERERAASARPGAHATDGGGRGRSGPELAATAPAGSGAPGLLLDRPGAAAPAPDASANAEPAHTSTRRWWWIGGAAALVAVAGGTAAAFALRSGDSTTTLHEGSLGSLRR